MKPDNETCFQNPQSCSSLVVRSNQFGRQNSNQIHWHQKPTRRHAAKGKFHTWWVEPSFVFVQHYPFQFCRVFWGGVEKNTKRFRWRKSHSKVETDDELGLAMQRKDSWCASFHCIKKPGENQTRKSNSAELADWAASKNRATGWRRLLIKLLRME